MADGDAVIDIQLCEGPVAYLPPESFPPSAGAECIFLGRTRLEHHPQHGRLLRLHYEAYRLMALGEMDRLAQEAIRRFDCLLVRIHHALGPVPPGEASVLIQVVSPHRGAAFDACRFLIDGLKAGVPIWKREEWADGTTWAEGSAVTTPEPE